VTDLGVVVTVAGRRSHLHHQLDGLARQGSRPDRVVVVRMDDAPLRVPAGVTVIDVPPVDGRLPLAAARNAGAAAAGTDAVLFLDVDCIPGHDLVAAMRRAVDQVDGLVCGTLRYLPAGVPAPGWTEADLWAASTTHPARPVVDPADLVRGDRYELAWTTCLGMRLDTFRRVGGFDERFVGYGCEDTDFGARAALLDTGVWWSGGVAYHQAHPESDRRDHLDDIVRNARLFAEIHGWYPMAGWLREFRADGLIDFDPAAGVLRVREPA
jgi:GT2 family glycosyltransferase